MDSSTVTLVFALCMVSAFLLTWQLAKWHFQGKHKPYMDMLSALVVWGFHPATKDITFWHRQAQEFEKAFNSLRPIPDAWSKEKQIAEQTARDVFGFYLNGVKGQINMLNYEKMLVKATGLYNEMASGTLRPSQLRTKSNLLTEAMDDGNFGFSAVHSGLGGLSEFFDDCVEKYLASQATGAEDESESEGEPDI